VNLKNASLSDSGVLQSCWQAATQPQPFLYMLHLKHSAHYLPT